MELLGTGQHHEFLLVLGNSFRAFVEKERSDEFKWLDFVTGISKKGTPKSG